MSESVTTWPTFDKGRNRDDWEESGGGGDKTGKFPQKRILFCFLFLCCCFAKITASCSTLSLLFASVVTSCLLCSYLHEINHHWVACLFGPKAPRKLVPWPVGRAQWVSHHIPPKGGHLVSVPVPRAPGKFPLHRIAHHGNYFFVHSYR